MTLLVASCGTGKTVMALNVIHRMGLRCAVLIHKKFLMDQWKERQETFLADARVDYFMMQGLKNNKSDLSCYGLVIVDECHHVPALTMKNALQKFPSRFRLGLTATPLRGDGYLWRLFLEGHRTRSRGAAVPSLLRTRLVRMKRKTGNGVDEVSTTLK